MDHLHAYSFPGFAFLLAQLIYRFVPYGNTLLIFILLFILLSGMSQFIYQVCCRRATGRASAPRLVKLTELP